MNQANALTIAAAVAAVVIPYLLTQSDVTVAPLLKVVLTAANLALVVVARLTNPGGTTPPAA